jgi:hypothetical protein
MLVFKWNLAFFQTDKYGTSKYPCISRSKAEIRWTHANDRWYARWDSRWTRAVQLPTGGTLGGTAWIRAGSQRGELAGDGNAAPNADPPTLPPVPSFHYQNAVHVDNATCMHAACNRWDAAIPSMQFSTVTVDAKFCFSWVFFYTPFVPVFRIYTYSKIDNLINIILILHCKVIQLRNTTSKLSTNIYFTTMQICPPRHRPAHTLFSPSFSFLFPSIFYFPLLSPMHGPEPACPHPPLSHRPHMRTASPRLLPMSVNNPSQRWRVMSPTYDHSGLRGACARRPRPGGSTKVRDRAPRSKNHSHRPPSVGIGWRDCWRGNLDLVGEAR